MNCESACITLQDIFLLIGLKARTGELVLEYGNNIGSIIFHNGNILHAFSPYSRAIGDLLVEEGIITETELLETLRVQKQSAISPIGRLFLKTGKVSFEVIELMVHQQIRQAVKEFTGWQKPYTTFVDKDIHPFDRIHLPIHEFIMTDTLKTARSFFFAMPDRSDNAPSVPSTSTKL